MARDETPNHLPAEVLAREDFGAACRNRDLGEVFRLAKKWGGPGFTASHLARRCELTVARVQDYINKRRKAQNLDLFTRVSDGLQIPGAMFGLAPRPWEGRGDSQQTTPSTQPIRQQVTEPVTPSPVALEISESLQRYVQTHRVLLKACNEVAQRVSNALAGLYRPVDNTKEVSDTENRDTVEVSTSAELTAIIEYTLRGLVDSMNRRDLFKLLGLTASTPFVVSILENLNLDEQERVFRAVSMPERVDAQVIDHIDSIIYSSYVNDSRLGPQSAFHTVLAQQGVLRQMMADCPDALRSRLVSVLSNALRICGWLTFNSGDMPQALQYYEQARTFAHDAQDVQMAAFVLTNMSHVAVWSNKPETAVDYSVAAVNWAEREDNPALGAFVSDMAAIAFSATGDYETAMRHLEKTPKYYLPRIPESRPSPPSPFYHYNEALHTARRGECLLNLGRTSDAISIIDDSLKKYERRRHDNISNMRNIAVGKLELSTAHVTAGDIDACVDVLMSVSEITRENRSNRIVNRMRSIREELQPWQSEPVVKNLDEQFRDYGILE